MNEIQSTKIVTLVPSQLKDNGAFANNGYVDVSGWGRARFIASVAALDAAIGSGDDSTPLKIEERDTSGGTYTDVTNAAMAAVIGATDDNKEFAIDVDLVKQSHKKYMRFNAPTAGDGTTGANMHAFVILSKPDGPGPGNAAEQGFESIVSV